MKIHRSSPKQHYTLVTRKHTLQYLKQDWSMSVWTWTRMDVKSAKIIKDKK